jgi:hypothetical protein
MCRHSADIPSDLVERVKRIKKHTAESSKQSDELK